MTWTRLSDDFADSPAVLGLSDAAFRCHVTALIWSNRQLTDGLIPIRAVHLFAASAEPVTELIAAGLWSANDDGYQLDWTAQESAETVRDRTSANAERNRRYRERGRRHAAGDHSMCDRCAALRASADASRDASRDTTRDASRAPYPSRPDPTRPVRVRGGVGGDAADAANHSRASAAPPAPWGAPASPRTHERSDLDDWAETLQTAERGSGT
jgi:hypothetical protein